MPEWRAHKYTFTREGDEITYRLDYKDEAPRVLKFKVGDVRGLKEWKREPTGRPIVFIEWGDGRGVELMGTVAQVQEAMDE